MLNLGDYLKSKRQQNGISLNQASEQTKIPQNLIKSLENSDYDAFSSEVYLKGFIKNYAKFLDIDVFKALAIYRRERSLQREDTLKDSQKPIKEQKPLITPGRLVLILTILIVLIVITFIAVQINKIIQPPLLELTEPVQTSAPGEAISEVNSETISLSGKIEVGSKLLINGNEVTTNNLQEFRVDNFQLNPGSNDIYIIAESYYFSKKSEIKLTVIYNEETTSNDQYPSSEDSDIEANQDQEEETNEVTMDIEIDIGEDEAWIVVTIDDEIKLQDVAESGSHFSFNATDTFTIYSPRPQVISLSINGEEYTFSSQSAAIFKIIDGNIVQE